MVFTRVNGKYSLEAKNLTKEEFCDGLRQLKRTQKFISDTICKAIEKRLNSITLEIK